MIASTAAAKRVLEPRSAAAAPPPGPAAAGSRPRSAHGTTMSETSGAAAIPIATTFCPDAIPRIAASANRQREQDSSSTSPP